MLSLGTALVGPVVDTLGPRCASISGGIMSSGGYIMLYFAQPGEASALAYLGLACVVIGGVAPYLGSFSVAALFTSPEVPIAAITGCFTLAGLDYQIVTLLGLSRGSTIIVFFCLQLLGLLLILLSAPAKPHRFGRPSPVLISRLLGCDEEAIGLAADVSPPMSPPLFSGSPDTIVNDSPSDTNRSSLNRRDSSLLPIQSRPMWMVVPSFWQNRRRYGVMGSIRRLSRRFSELRTEADGNLTEASFWAQSTSPEYLGMTLWYTLNLTWMLYFFTYLGPIINDKTFCSVVNWVGNGMPAFLSFFVGFLISRCGIPVMSAVASFLTIGMFLLSTMQNLWLGYVALALFTLQRSMIFAIFFSFIPMVFGSENYGTLIGLATFISGAFGFVNTPIGQWAGFAQSSNAVCPTGVTCGSWWSCSTTSWTLAATLVPMLLYSAWLGRRSKNRSAGVATNLQAPRVEQA